MAATTVLLHGPSVGPLTWRPVAEQLRSRGRAVAVPNLLTVAEGSPPYWPAVRDAVLAAVDGIGDDLVLVPHSNAGLFVPVIAGVGPEYGRNGPRRGIVAAQSPDALGRCVVARLREVPAGLVVGCRATPRWGVQDLLWKW